MPKPKNANAKKSKPSKQSNGNGIAALTAELWQAAVNLRGSIEPADYKRYVLPIIFLRFLSLRYERRRAELERLIADPASEYHTTDQRVAADILADADEYRRAGAFIVPESARWSQIRNQAQADDIKVRLDDFGLRAWPKTTGQSGLHIYVPLRRRADQDQVRKWVGELAHQVALSLPQLVTENWAVGARKGRLRIDYTQNVVGKTLAAVYSPRPAPGAPVSTPIEWTELDHIDPSQFTLRTVLERLRLRGDLFRPVLEGGQSLPRLPATSDPADRAGDRSRTR